MKTGGTDNFSNDFTLKSKIDKGGSYKDEQRKTMQFRYY